MEYDIKYSEADKTCELNDIKTGDCFKFKDGDNADKLMMKVTVNNHGTTAVCMEGYHRGAVSSCKDSVLVYPAKKVTLICEM
jgi:hypothetical protein